MTAELQEAEANKSPLVGEAHDLHTLATEFRGADEHFAQKVGLLIREGAVRQYRKVRGDGNCFFRAFAFALFDKRLVSTTRRLEEVKQVLLQANFQPLAFDDFADATVDLSKAQHDPPTLLAEFNKPETTNAVVVYLRFVASAWIKTHREMYAAFVEEDVDEYCTRVEAFGNEADDVMLAALTDAMHVHLDVLYLDRTDGPATVHPFGQGEAYLTLLCKFVAAMLI